MNNENEVIYRDYNDILNYALRINQITLFSLQGEELPLGYERHVATFSEYFIWRSETERINYSLQLAIDVWASWEIHMKKSNYSLPYFGGVHLEEEWLSGHGGPPCILMSNESIKQNDEKPNRSPIEIEWKSQKILGPLAIFNSSIPEQEISYWRFYLADNLKG
jgi:hypothetical protein